VRQDERSEKFSRRTDTRANPEQHAIESRDRHTKAEEGKKGDSAPMRSNDLRGRRRCIGENTRSSRSLRNYKRGRIQRGGE
jgi:hypothetical protein